MNLALLDPFRRQVPDRIDSTLTLPRNFHPRRPVDPSNSTATGNTQPEELKPSKLAGSTIKKRKKSSALDPNDEEIDLDEMNEWHSCFTVAFNRRGNYIAAGHGSGAVPFHDFSSRTLSSIFTPPHNVLRCAPSEKHSNSDDDSLDADEDMERHAQERLFRNGVTSISWSRRSRRLLVASFGDKHVCLVDNTHPFGVQDAFYGLTSGSRGLKAGIDSNGADSPFPTRGAEEDSQSQGEADEGFGGTETKTRKDHVIHVNRVSASKNEYRSARYIKKTKLFSFDSELPSSPKKNDEKEESTIQTSQYQTLTMPLSKPLGVCAQIHPRGNGGLACLEDGSLILFRFPTQAFRNSIYSEPKTFRKIIENEAVGQHIYLSQPSGTDDNYEVKAFNIICATFDAHGKRVYAVTRCGKLLFFQLDNAFVNDLFKGPSHEAISHSPSNILSKYFFMEIGANNVTHQIVLSRNDQMILLNCKDSLKLYDTSECWSASPELSGEITVTPKFTFQDVVSKSKWNACDFSGDGEYVVGGCNNEEAGDKYELYFWNTATGK
jgi:hypothetical protein